MFRKKTSQSICAAIEKGEYVCLVLDCDTTPYSQAPPHQSQVMRAGWINTSLMLLD